MEALLRVARRPQGHALVRIACTTRSIGTSTSLDETLANLSASIIAKHGGPYVRIRLHPEWKQVDNRSRRMESRLGDFRISTNELRIQKAKLEKGEFTTELEKTRLVSFIKQREEDVKKERVAIHGELLKLTAMFVEGAEREYATLRKFFLLFVYNTTWLSSAHEHLEKEAFSKLLNETTDGITFDAPKRGTVTIPPRLCKILARAAQDLTVNTAGVDTSTLSIALAVVQTFPNKHCGNKFCKREDCIAIKPDHEELFERYFKVTARSLVFDSSRGEMALHFDGALTIPVKEAPPSAETESSKETTAPPGADAAKEAPKETSAAPSTELPKETTASAGSDAATEAPKETSAPPSTEVPKETTAYPGADAAKEAPKEAPTAPCTEVHKETTTLESVALEEAVPAPVVEVSKETPPASSAKASKEAPPTLEAEASPNVVYQRG